MKIIKHLLIILLTVCFFACSEDDNLFSGTDNYIKQFTITQGNDKYFGVFEGDSVIVYFKNGVYSQGMEATIELSENAKIFPNPQEVGNWLEEQQFVVTSYNGTRRTYRYIPKIGEVNHSGDVVLRTQEEVDAFAGSGITVISGNLIIGNLSGQDSISSTEGFRNLKKVDYDITINSCYNGENLTLENLEEVGSIKRNSSNKITQIVLPNLKRINLSANFGSVYELEVPNLEIVGKDFTVGNLSQMYCTLAFPNLKKVDGTLTINNTNFLISMFTLPKLEEAGSLTLSFYTYNMGFPMLQKVTGAINISNNNMLALDLPKLKTVGNISLSGSNLVKLNMSKLEETGNISFTNLKIKELDFSLLQTAANITLSGIENINELAFPVLKKAQNFSLSKPTNLKTLDLGASEIGGLTLSDFQSISIKGTGKMTGTLYLSGTALSCKITGIKEIGAITSYTSAPYLECAGLEQVNGNVYVQHYEKMLFPDLKKITGSLTFQCYYAQDTTDSHVTFAKLETVGGALSVSGSNDGLTHLNMFSSLKSAQSIAVTNLKKLVDYTGLKNVIHSITDKNWRATGNAYNPTYQDLLNGKWTNQ
ncbi:hypothetical protein [Proteiniphilum sp.]|nr:hypothetical protein [Proteiniphilum sp.]MEA4918275.1 hypothetical protein [Proteiniphilum sp.]